MNTENRDSLPFQDRRQSDRSELPGGVDRRQFANSHTELSPGARELGQAIDRYKLENRRKYITYEEMYSIVLELGYRQPENHEPSFNAASLSVR